MLHNDYLLSNKSVLSNIISKNLKQRYTIKPTSKRLKHISRWRRDHPICKTKKIRPITDFTDQLRWTFALSPFKFDNQDYNSYTLSTLKIEPKSLIINFTVDFIIKSICLNLFDSNFSLSKSFVETNILEIKSSKVTEKINNAYIKWLYKDNEYTFTIRAFSIYNYKRSFNLYYNNKTCERLHKFRRFKPFKISRNIEDFDVKYKRSKQYYNLNHSIIDTNQNNVTETKIIKKRKGLLSKKHLNKPIRLIDKVYKHLDTKQVNLPKQIQQMDRYLFCHKYMNKLSNVIINDLINIFQENWSLDLKTDKSTDYKEAEFSFLRRSVKIKFIRPTTYRFHFILHNFEMVIYDIIQHEANIEEIIFNNEQFYNKAFKLHPYFDISDTIQIKNYSINIFPMQIYTYLNENKDMSNKQMVSFQIGDMKRSDSCSTDFISTDSFENENKISDAWVLYKPNNFSSTRRQILRFEEKEAMV